MNNSGHRAAATAALCWGVFASMIQALIAAAFESGYLEWISAPHTDVPIYFAYASRIFGGEIPYRQFDVEYPFFALPVFLIPRLFASDLTAYRIAFGLEMALFNTMTIFLIAGRTAGLRDLFGRLAWYTLFSGLLCPLMLGRYDLAPTFFAFAAAMLWASGRPSVAGGLAGVGVLMKVFPGACALPALAREVARFPSERPRGMLALATVCCLGAANWVLVGGRGVDTALDYHMRRGIEVESVYAGLCEAIGLLGDDPPSVAFNFGAYHLAGPWAGRLSSLAFPLQVASLLTVLAMYRRSGYTEPIRYAAAALLAFVTLGKVLSPQYMIWLVPFVVAVDGPTGRWVRLLFGLSCLDTVLIYPVFFEGLLRLDPRLLLLVNLRNASLLAALTLLTFGPGVGPTPGGERGGGQ